MYKGQWYLKLELIFFDILGISTKTEIKIKNKKKQIRPKNNYEKNYPSPENGKKSLLFFFSEFWVRVQIQRAPLGPYLQKTLGHFWGPTGAQRLQPQSHNYFAPGEFVGAQRPGGPHQHLTKKSPRSGS